MFARALVLIFVVSCLSGGCYRNSHTSAPGASAEQKIIDRSAEAFRRIRSAQHPALEYFIEHAHGVMIFPRIIKASMIFGGEGGNGVLLSKDARGWSAPAFYSMGAGSAGLQVGYQEATVVLFFMKEAALRSTIERGITLGSDATVAAGTVGGSGKGVAGTAASDIYQFIEVGGLFAGLSLDGTVVGARDSFNRAYYGADATPYSILLERRHAAPGATTLHQVLAMQVPAAPAGGTSTPALLIEAGTSTPPDAGAEQLDAAATPDSAPDAAQ
jgi:lipid-binding SYLF domain-containing protein